MSAIKGRLVTRSCAECGAHDQAARCAQCGATEACRTCGELYHADGDGFDDECPPCADRTDEQLGADLYGDDES